MTHPSAARRSRSVGWLLIKADAPDSFWATSCGSSDAYRDLTWSRFLGRNLVPVTLGNLIGGALLVGLVYAFVYLRQPEHQRP
jgi:formate transporter